MHNGPLVSVLIPVFRFDEYLQFALKSISSQTYKNIEVIVVAENDFENISSIAKNFGISNIRVVEGKNKGLAAALNLGILECKGAYIARMDSDDISSPQRIKKQMEYLTRNHLDICGSSIKAFGKYSRRLDFPSFDDDIALYSIFASPLAHPTVFGKAETFRKYSYDEQYLSCEDYELWTRMIIAGVRLGSINDVLLQYRVHPNQLSIISKSQKKNECYIRKTLAKKLGSSSLNQALMSVNYLEGECIETADILKIIHEMFNSLDKNHRNSIIFERIILSMFNRSCEKGWIIALEYFRCSKLFRYTFNPKYYLWFLLRDIIPGGVIPLLKKYLWK